MGTFVARKSGQNKFKISEIVEWVDGKPKTKSVPKNAWFQLGFRPEMSLEQAKARAKELNKTRQLEAKKIVSIGRRVEDVKQVRSVYLPSDLVSEFTQWLADNKVRGSKQKEKLFSHWELAQTIIAEAKLFPQDFYLNAGKLLSFFVRRKYSMSYVRKIMAVLNWWGTFYASKKSTPYYPLKNLDSSLTGEIERAYSESDGFVGPSDPLTPEMLEAKKSSMKPEQWQWLYCTVWLGLRPSEIEQRNQKRRSFEIYFDEDAGCEVLRIFQPKLRNKPDVAWKFIPLFLPEMITAAGYLSGDLKAPTLKTMHATFKGRVTLYGGRQGFVSLMVNRHSQDINQVSNWLGHTNIYRTKRSYERRNKVSFKAG